MKKSLILSVMAMLCMLACGCGADSSPAVIAADKNPQATASGLEAAQHDRQPVLADKPVEAVDAAEPIRPDSVFFSDSSKLEAAEDMGLSEGDIVTVSGKLEDSPQDSYCGLFSFDPGDGSELTIALLPNSMLDQMQRTGGDKQAKFEITGEVTVYHEKVYVLVTRSVILD